MTLILTKAPPQAHQGVDPASKIIRPGGRPPMVHPVCRQCGVPVETFTIDPISSWYYLGIDATCHGKTHGIRVPAEQALRDGAAGKTLMMF